MNLKEEYCKTVFVRDTPYLSKSKLYDNKVKFKKYQDYNNTKYC